jgi:hypothetical protein
VSWLDAAVVKLGTTISDVAAREDGRQRSTGTLNTRFDIAYISLIAHSRHSAARRGSREVGAVLIRRVTLMGLVVMGAAALCSVIWPVLAAVVANLFVTLLVGTVAVPAGLGVRWVRREVAWRHELRAMPPVPVVAGAGSAAEPTLTELRKPA